MQWKDFLEPQEAERLAELDRQRASLTKEYRRIYDRCRKRMEKARG